MNCIILIFPEKGFFVIGYRGNLKDEAQTILVELLTQDKNKRLNIDLFISEETETYHENYKITKRFAGGCDCKIIPDMALSHLCDMLVVISEKKLKQEDKAESFSFFNCCNIL